ncbi:carbamoyltransferase N-terminal domain-containing protein [Streptomyces luteolus]|uniref:Carbamoyltransferase N-terminal domain-containing protein n=1 Tax=Streptomyces luteolus TaxID=3043615 RepID=A0ABT6T655_9ACTN|nr:carbamoyltransferase N-terminal domain-containing protein [Streptomyces sp. B-S-A12]MDI3423367.1 carbamoyltransferase N-terminal domain-containing protein [Streptomyces sp. B-S-A12]
MLICGIKVSHDGGIAVLDGNRLLFSIETEKIDNSPRYSPLGDLRRVPEILRSEGVEPEDIDRFVVDGWRLSKENPCAVSTSYDGQATILPVAPYADGVSSTSPLHRYTFTAHDFSKRTLGYTSYHHVSNHLLGAYCSSPFAAGDHDALALVWDGGTTARLYEITPKQGSVKPVARLLPFRGRLFALFSANLGPFRKDASQVDLDADWRYRSVPGKAMAYAALGNVEQDALPALAALLGGMSKAAKESSLALGRELAAKREHLFPGMSDADLIATFQDYLGRALVSALKTVVQGKYKGRYPRLVMAGGCALNIKWNSAIRETGLFEEIWVPPFPNDSGAAIGTACCEMVHSTEHRSLVWDVHSGPRLYRDGTMPEGWRVRACDERQLAELLHIDGSPVVVLSGRAELGPRALGNRSIIAPATDSGTKDLLNTMKEREAYRPVAPVCLAHRASEVFDPGCDDPFMLFDHRVRPQWVSRIPAVVHLDGTARLQTISPTSSSAIARILTAYEELTGIPVLCNTSANYGGRGFFPSIASAAEWGRTSYVWSDGRLFTHPAQAEKSFLRS